MIHYPITDNGTELADAGAFIGGMMDKTVTESDCDAIKRPDLKGSGLVSFHIARFAVTEVIARDARDDSDFSVFFFTR